MRSTHAYRCAIAIASGELLTLAVGAHASADELIPGPNLTRGPASAPRKS
jgi:hypothetical protein